MDFIWIMVLPVIMTIGLLISSHFKDQQRLDFVKTCYEQIHDVEKCNKQAKELIND